MKNFRFPFFFVCFFLFVSGKFLSFEAKRQWTIFLCFNYNPFFVCFAFFLARFSYRKALIIDFKRKEESLKGSKCKRLIGSP